MNILVDYLTFTIKEYSLKKFLNEIHFTTVPYITGGGMFNYEHSVSFAGIHICFNGSFNFECSDMFTISMSGKGCRTFESLFDLDIDWLRFIYHYMRIENNDYKTAKAHIARLDIACDDKPEDGEQPILNYKTLRNHYEKDKFICKAKKHTQSRGTETEEFEQCIYFGSPRTDRRCRIYNKALERTENGKPYNGHWIRCELQLRNDNALSFYLTALEVGSIGQCFSGMLLDYLRFTTETNKKDHNQSRLNTCKWWTDFTNHSAKIKGFKIGGAAYNLDSLCNYLRTQCSSSILTYIAINDGNVDSLFNLFDDCTINKKQEKLIHEVLHNRAAARREELKKLIKEYGLDEIQE